MWLQSHWKASWDPFSTLSLYPNHMCSHQCVLPQHFWIEDTESNLEVLAIWNAWQGRSRHTPGTSRLEGSEPTRQLLWAHCLGEPQTAWIAKRFPQHLETNHQSFLTTKVSTTIIHPNHISFPALIAKVNQSILHLVSHQSFQGILYFFQDMA